MILNCFIISEIHREIVVLQPTSITQALGIAKLLESKINDSKCYTRNSHPLSQPSQNLLPSPRLSFHTPKKPTSANLLPIKKLTSTQL